MIKTRSCQQLFVKCIALSILLNVLFYAMNLFNKDNLTIYFISGVIQLCAGLVLGFYIRKKNKDLIWKEDQERKRYAVITFIGLLCLVIVICFPDIIAMPYAYLTGFIYQQWGLNRVFTVFDFGTILICLGSVFFRKTVIREHSL